MSLVGDIIKNEVVDPAFRSYTLTMMCTILEVNGSADTITVVPATKQGESHETEGTMSVDKIENISILNYKALKEETPNPGDCVYLSFNDHELTNAIMIALIRAKDPNQNDTSKTQENPDETKIGEVHYAVEQNLTKAMASIGTNNFARTLEKN